MATFDELLTKARELKAQGRLADAKRVAEIAIRQRDAVKQGSVNPAIAPVQQPPKRSFGETLYQNVIGRGPADTFGEKLGQQIKGVGAGAMRGTADLATLLAPAFTPMNTGRKVMSRITGGESNYVAPGTLGKYGSSFGEFLPGTAIGGGGLGKIAKYALGGSIGSETAGLATRGTKYEPYARLFGALIGTGGAAGLESSLQKVPKPPSLAQLKLAEKSAWGTVDKSTIRLTPQSTEKLSANVVGKMSAEGMDPMLNPKAARMTGIIEERAGQTPRIMGIEKLRRKAGNAVASSKNADEARLGVLIKKEIKDYLDGVKTGDFMGGTKVGIRSQNIDKILAALNKGRATTQRVKKIELINEMTHRGQMAASTSGTGGNFINTTRQQFKGLLNNKQSIRGFSKEERAMMQSIVDGNPTVNALRWASRFSPTAGALPGALGAGLGGAALWGGNPALAGIPAMGLAGKILGERMTRQSVQKLVDYLRRGGPAPARTNPDTLRALSAAMLGSRMGAQ